MRETGQEAVSGINTLIAVGTKWEKRSLDEGWTDKDKEEDVERKVTH